jgi:NTE family protein
LANSNPVIDKVIKSFAYMNYDSFDNKYFPKRMVFSGDIQSFFSLQITNTFNPFSIAKLILDLQQQF